MDDIYYWVLRVWGALTSKKALVFVACVAAVVVTVSTVFAAPLSDAQPAESSDVFVSMEPPKIQGPVVRTFVTMDPMEELSIGGVDSPGTLPTSPFFFAKGIVRDVRYAFTFDPVDKANLKLRYANEDALSIRAMVLAGEYLEAAQQCFSYQDNFFNSLAWAVKARKQGNDIETLMLNLMLAHDKHRLVLADALCTVEESQLEAVMGAITYTSAPFEQVIKWTNGPEEAVQFYTKLSNDFSSVGGDIWLQIENRLGLDIEQAVALSQAMGDRSTVGDAPVISSVKAERTLDVEPGSTIAIACSAADLSGGELTYKWVAAKGEIAGDGPSVDWIAPDAPGLYTVSVIVSDERGNQSRKSISIRVGDVAITGEGEHQGTLQTIELEVVPDGHTLLSAPVVEGS
ncbi:MAG: hypothetical protein GX600_04210, partial [Dehalococcoidia bacterium]|nr:hypothetical protein [Dehalococcoidia bacterium]